MARGGYPDALYTWLGWARAWKGRKRAPKKISGTYSIAGTGEVVDIDSDNGVFGLGIVLARHFDSWQWEVGTRVQLHHEGGK